MPKVPVYIQHQIKMAELFHPKHVPDYTTEKGLMQLFDRMNNDLSPENISCDGELSRTAVQKKMREINAAWKFCEKQLGRSVEKEC